MNAAYHVEDTFFKTATDATLSYFAKHGAINVNITALIQTGDELSTYPIENITFNGATDQTLEDALLPLVEFVARTSSDVKLFVVSALANGSTMNKKTGEVVDGEMIVSGVRLISNVGRTRVDRVIRDSGVVSFERITGPKTWAAAPSEVDLPGKSVQKILTEVWTHYITLLNVYKLRYV